LVSNDDNFEVLLPISSLLNPKESKEAINLNRTKVFTQENFDQDIYEKNWNQIKFVCTQPFNLTIQYGISKIKIYGDPQTHKESNINLGIFKAKNDTVNDDSKQKESIFSKWLKNKETNKDDNKVTKNEPKLAKKIIDYDEEVVTKKKDTKATQEKVEKKTDLKLIMKNKIVFTLSGFQNPERSNIRDKGIEMGAYYKPDWDDECTHLICAFSNTPKYTQVKKSNGIIVKKEWIFDCYKEKKLLDTKKYELESNEKKSETKDRRSATNKSKKYKDSDDESVASENSDDRNFIDDKNSSEEEESEFSIHDTSSDSKDEQITTSEDEKPTRAKKLSRRMRPRKESTSSIDEKKRELKKRDNTPDTVINSDIDDDLTKAKEPWELPDLFENKTFFIYGDYSNDDRRLFKRLIYAYGGTLVDYMSDNVDYLITNKEWNDDFDGIKDNLVIKIVSHDWLIACGTRKGLLSTKPYEVVRE
jgi:DNA-repair protein XRCC1